MILNTFSKFVVLFCCLALISASDNNEDSKVTSVIGIVRKDDLLKYVNSLETALGYWGNHTDHETSSLYLGVFLMKVNLENILRKRVKSLPTELLDRMEDLMNLNKRVLRAFNRLVMHGRILGSSKKVLTLISNENAWASRLENFRVGAWEHMPLSKIRNELMLYNWTLYCSAVHDYFSRDDRSSEDQQNLGKCYDKLSDLPLNTPKICLDTSCCKSFLETVKDYGYGVAQKLLTLQMAHFGRGCYLFSQQVDQELRLQYCQSIYEETDLIADNRFQSLADLFSQQIFLCALEGHAEFLQRSWLAKALQMQRHDVGCFQPNEDEYSIYTTSLHRHHRRYYDKSYCSERTSGMMIGALSVAIRFILQFYY